MLSNLLDMTQVGTWKTESVCFLTKQIEKFVFCNGGETKAGASAVLIFWAIFRLAVLIEVVLIKKSVYYTRENILASPRGDGAKTSKP